jgi:hypothetical protein
MDRPMEIVPSMLYWAPGLDPYLQKDSLRYVNALEVGHSDGKVGMYRVPHYDPKICRAFGPFALDEILRFCRGVNSILHFATTLDVDKLAHSEAVVDTTSKFPLCLTTALGDSKAHTNACVLLGAYLILCENWSAKDVANKLGKEDSERVFRGSWAESWVLKVSHCWEGLVAARDHAWIDLACLSDDALLETTCEHFKTMAFTYDCAWIVPSKILVSADPITTLCDPNPQTFNALWEDEDGVSTCASTTSSPSMNTDTEWDIEPEVITNNAQKAQNKLNEIIFDPISRGEPSTLTRPSFGKTKSQSFRSFVQECGVSLVIRNNLPDERGMPKASYDGVHWKTYNIDHIDLQFPDGTTPPSSIVASAISPSLNMLESNLGAILVHCKGGLGRSVTLACCVACYQYDIPGRALLGWARMTRPGAFNTIEQEKFLLSFKGRADVLRFTRKGLDGVEPGAKVSCGCVLQ